MGPRQRASFDLVQELLRLDRQAMFSGIVESVCKVVAVRAGVPSAADASTGAVRLEVELGGLLAELRLGASVAIDGVCLTLADRRGQLAGFDVVPETWRTTNLCDRRPGDRVNVERALRLGERLDGHFVQGHIDGVGRINRIDRRQSEYKLWIEANAGLMPYIVRKGAVALDGTSLTVIDVKEGRFSVALIPTTLASTVLSERRPGDRVNIETDILARLVISRLEALVGGDSTSTEAALTWKHLQESGFLP